MADIRHYVVVYDIEDDRERQKVGKVLEGFGRRVQKSVFECPLTRRSRAELDDRLAKLAIETGFVLIYRLNDQAQRGAAGNVPADLTTEAAHAFVA